MKHNSQKENLVNVSVGKLGVTKLEMQHDSKIFHLMYFPTTLISRSHSLMIFLSNGTQQIYFKRKAAEAALNTRHLTCFTSRWEDTSQHRQQ